MALTKCLICTKEFYVRPNHIIKGWGKFCSIKCRTKSQLKGKILGCATCQKEIYKSKANLKKSLSGKYFCNKSCQTVWRNKTLFSGDKHSNWKNGEASYRKFLLRSEVKMICLLCKTNDKRILAVHHKDKNRKNNKLENLAWLCHNCHYLVHHDQIEKEKFDQLKG